MQRASSSAAASHRGVTLSAGHPQSCDVAELRAQLLGSASPRGWVVYRAGAIAGRLHRLTARLRKATFTGQSQTRSLRTYLAARTQPSSLQSSPPTETRSCAECGAGDRGVRAADPPCRPP